MTDSYFTGEHHTEVIVLGVISTISTVSVFLLILYLFVTSFLPVQERDKDERILLRTHFGLFVVFLFLCDLIQGISGMLQFGWASQNHITPGALCTAQAVMLQIGDIGTAVWNAIIAIHTFWAVVLGRKMTGRGVACLTVVGWAICLLLTTIGPLAVQTQAKGPFYGDAGAWCFIMPNYAYPRVLVHYLPMLLSAFVITVLYVLVALVLFRVLIVVGNTWRFEAPTRKTGSVVRDFFGQFSWNRIYRPSHSSTARSVVITRSDGGLTGLPDSIGGGWMNSPQSPSNRDRKISETQSQPSVPEFEDPLSAMSVRLKKLAIKMLWYPSVYLILILPITVCRMNPNVTIDLSVMLAFTCLLLFMGTANTIIFIFTRRLGPAPWARSALHSKSKAERGEARRTASNGTLPLQIRIDQYTQRGLDDQSIHLPRKNSFTSILTDITTMSTVPPVMQGTSKADSTLIHQDGTLGIDSSGETSTRNVTSPSSLSDPHMVGMHQFHPYSPERQEQYSLYPFTLPEPPAQQEEQEQPQQWAYPHPYSRSPFPM